MNIYAENGDKVIFINDTSGYESDQEKAKKYLEKGKVYTVAATDVGGWHTDVYLKEIPGQAFNSVLFEDYTEKHIVRLIGCDASNEFIMELTEEEVTVLEKLSAKSIEFSTYDCMPILKLELATEEDLEQEYNE